MFIQTKMNMSGSLSNLPPEVCDRIRAFLPFEELHNKKTNITAIAIAQLPKEKPSTPKEYIAKLLEGANVLLSYDINYHHEKLREVDANIKALTYAEAEKLYTEAEKRLIDPKDKNMAPNRYQAELMAMKRYDKLLRHLSTIADSRQMDELLNRGVTPEYYEQLFPYAMDKKVIVLDKPEKIAAFLKMIQKKSFNRRICVKIQEPNLALLQQFKKIANPEFVRVNLGERKVIRCPQGLSEWVSVIAVGFIAFGGSAFGLYKLFSVMNALIAAPATLFVYASTGAMFITLEINAKSRMRCEDQFAKKHLQMFRFPI